MGYMVLPKYKAISCVLEPMDMTIFLKKVLYRCDRVRISENHLALNPTDNVLRRKQK